jgi:hypothetical protein
MTLASCSVTRMDADPSKNMGVGRGAKLICSGPNKLKIPQILASN